MTVQYQSQNTPPDLIAANHLPYQVVTVDADGNVLSLVAEFSDPTIASAIMEQAQAAQTF